jgi:hypothetical protein
MGDTGISPPNGKPRGGWLAGNLDPSVRWGSLVAASVAAVYRTSGFHEHGAAFIQAAGPQQRERAMVVTSRYFFGRLSTN